MVHIKQSTTVDDNKKRTRTIFSALYWQIAEITCLIQNTIPGLSPTESCESTRDGGGRRVQFVPDSAGVSVADVGFGCILASHSFAWFSVF